MCQIVDCRVSVLVWQIQMLLVGSMIHRTEASVSDDSTLSYVPSESLTVPLNASNVHTFPIKVHQCQLHSTVCGHSIGMKWILCKVLHRCQCSRPECLIWSQGPRWRLVRATVVCMYHRVHCAFMYLL